MASVQTAMMVGIIAFLLAPGVLLSIPPGPNKKWLLGGQVTWTNALVHAVVIGIVVYYFAQ
jgi:hypothetical protein